MRVAISCQLKKLLPIRRQHHGVHKLLDRVVLLEGVPYLESEEAIEPEENIREQFERARIEAESYRKFLADGIAKCGEEGDPGTGKIFGEILCCVEESIKYLEGQLTAIDKSGLNNYLPEQMEY